MKHLIAGTMLLLMVLSCGSESRESGLLDSMPAGHDIYITFNPFEIGIDEVLSSVEEIVSQGEQLPVAVSDILNFDPFDWEGWTEALALRPDGEMGLLLNMDDSGDEPELIALFLSSSDASLVEEFFNGILTQADAPDVYYLVTESQEYVVLAIAPSQDLIDDFEESLGTLINTDREFNQLREKSAAGVPALEIFAEVGLMSSENEVELMLLSCFADDANLGFQIVVKAHDADALESAAVVSASPNSGSASIPSDAIGALRLSLDIEVLKEMIPSAIPPEGEMAAGMLGFNSINDFIDVFSGDMFFAIRTDGSEYAGVIQYGLEDKNAIDDLLTGLSEIMGGTSGQGYSTFDFQGSTCYRFDVEIAPGINSTEAGIVDDFLVLAGGYTLADVAEGISFSEFLENTGLGIKDDGGFAIAVDIGLVMEAFDVSSQTGDLLDLEELGYFVLTGNIQADVFEINGAVDLGSGNPFVTIMDAIGVIYTTQTDVSEPLPVIEEQKADSAPAAPVEEPDENSK